MKLALITRVVTLNVLLALVSAGLVGCNNKEAEDVAAMRALMEKQEKEKEEQKRKDAEGIAEMQRKAKETRKQMGLDK